MKHIDLYCRGARCGEAAVHEEEGRLVIRAEMDDPGDGLYRAVLRGDRGELSLGVMEPRDGKLVLHRRPALCDTARVGTVRSIQAGCSFSFRKKSPWQATDRPAELFSDPILRSALTAQPRGFWRRGEKGITLALPLQSDAPFPLESLFCFARVERVEGEVCVIYTFDEVEMPVYAKTPEKT